MQNKLTKGCTMYERDNSSSPPPGGPAEPLAKAPSAGGKGITLSAHAAQVARYLQQLLDAYRPALAPLIRETIDEWARSLITAALVHDIGKANEGFQTSLSKRSPWEFRHEALSVAYLPGATSHDDPWFYSLASILTHHKDVDDERLLGTTGATASSSVLDIVKRNDERMLAGARPYAVWITEYLEMAGLKSTDPDMDKVRQLHRTLLHEQLPPPVPAHPRSFLLTLSLIHI